MSDWLTGRPRNISPRYHNDNGGVGGSVDTEPTPTLLGSTMLIDASSGTGVTDANPTQTSVYWTGVQYGKLAIVTLQGNFTTTGVGACSATWNALLPAQTAVTPIGTCEVTGIAPSGELLPQTVTLATNGNVTVGGGNSLSANTYRFQCCFAIALV